MRAAFLGTPASAVPSLAALVDVADVEVVITRPDAARGRSQRVMPPPVKIAAAAWGLEVSQPDSATRLLEALSSRSLDIGVVVAYGRILSPEILATTSSGFVNVHFSLLPRWRGPAPVERAILAGDETTGVTLMVLEEGIDTGPVVSVIETPISDDETGGSLTARLSYLGATLIDDVLPNFVAGSQQPAAQIEAAATDAPRLKKSEARLTVDLTSDAAVRSVRAFNPRPGAWVSLDGSRLKILVASESPETPEPGHIVVVGGEPVLGLNSGGVRLESVRPAGKNVVSGRDWVNGRRGRGGVIDSLPP